MPAPQLPDGTIEILAGTPPGGGQDRAARALAAALGDVVDHPIVVSNLPGRGGSNAWDRIAAERGGPLRVSISSPTLLTNHLTGVSEFGHTDFTQIALLCTEYIAFGAAASSPLATPQDLMAALVGEPRPTVALATSRGNVNHIAVALVARHCDVDPAEIEVRVFDSARQAVADAIDGNADLVAVSGASVLPEVESGSVRVIATSSPERLGAPLRSTPTWTESGVDCIIGTWRGLIAAPGMPDDHTESWHRVVAAALQRPQWRQALSDHVWADTHLGPEDTERFMAVESARMHRALADLGLLPG